MRSTLSCVACLLLLVAGCQEKPAPAAKYGAALSLADETRVSQILSDPENFLGKKVLIRGEVLDVCAQAGCWMEVAGDQPGQRIKVKVNDGEIVFPMQSKGKKAQVEGEVYRIDLSREQAQGYMAHLAEEQGTAFDSSSVSGPMRIYQIKGLGAEVFD